jgi:hypothetical protein
MLVFRQSGGWFGVGGRFVVVVCGVRLQKRLCLQSRLRLLSWQKTLYLLFLFRGYFVFLFCLRSVWFVSFRFSSISPTSVRFCCIVCNVLCLLVINVTQY